MGPRGRNVTVVIALTLALLVGLGVVSGTFTTWGAALRSGSDPSPSAGTSSSPVPTPTPTPTLTPRPVLGRSDDGATPLDRDRLRAALAAVTPTGVGRVAGVVIDPADGSVVYDGGAATASTPASTIKLLTVAGALDAYGPERRFTTRVVDAGDGRLVLVGGGDPYLLTSRDADDPDKASLEVLARRTAEALAATGVTEVTLDYDASLFAGPAWNPTWPDGYRPEVAPTAALWVDGARTRKVSPGPRDPDPPRAAATAFVAQLAEVGVTARLGASTTTATDDPLAEVDSEPLSVIAEQVLRSSDNDAAEVLFRHVSRAADGDGSIADARTALPQRLVAMGLLPDTAAVGVTSDGSGMSRQNAIPPRAVAAVVAAALDGEHPQLAAIVSGLPVAGSEGTLRGRFFATGTGDGLGLVRAKTGTLTGRHGLGGYVRTESGHLLAFAFLVTDGDAYADRVHLDRLAAAIAGCAC